MDRRPVQGQAAVEYVLLLLIFTAVALEAWRLLYPSLSGVYQHFSVRRAGPLGMLP